MDPISALNVAAATFQFIDFSFKALALCKEIRNSGSTKGNAELEILSKTLDAINKEFEGALKRNPKSSKRLLKLANDCRSSVGDLSKVLKELRDVAQKKSLAVAFYRTLKERKTIEKLENRMKNRQKMLNDALTPEILIRLEGLSKEIADQIFTYHTKTRSYFEDLIDDRKRSAVLHSERHEQLKERIDQVRQTSSHLETAVKNGQSELIKHVDRQLERHHAQIDASDTSKRLLSSLFYPQITSREEIIKPPWSHTYEWIFDESEESRQMPWSSFSHWLRSENSIYWVNGKAGSGKSTLMAHIVTHEQTPALLSEWSHGLNLHIIKFFFWQSGSPLQRTVQGLLRSLLYQICQSAEETIPHIAGDGSDWSHGLPEWTLKRLIAATEVALTSVPRDRFCIFLDGLDEYEGDYDELIDLITSLQKQNHVKFCVSSRPELLFIERFKGFASLRLQDLNEKDIDTYVRGRMQSCSSREKTDQQDIASTITAKSEGVFLWAVLVTSSLLEGLKNGDKASIIENRLSAMPKELSRVYTEMLSRINPLYYKPLSSLLSLLDSSSRWGDLSVAEIAVLCNPELIMTYDILEEECERTERQILSQSCGLLEVSFQKQEMYLDTWTQHMKDYVWVSSQGAGRDFESIWDAPLTPSHIGDFSCSIERLMRYRSSRVSWVHRSARDFLKDSQNEFTIRLPELLEGETFLRILAECQLTLYASIPSSPFATTFPCQRRLQFLDHARIHAVLSQLEKPASHLFLARLQKIFQAFYVRQPCSSEIDSSTIGLHLFWSRCVMQTRFGASFLLDQLAEGRLSAKDLSYNGPNSLFHATPLSACLARAEIAPYIKQKRWIALRLIKSEPSSATEIAFRLLQPLLQYAEHLHKELDRDTVSIPVVSSNIIKLPYPPGDDSYEITLSSRLETARTNRSYQTPVLLLDLLSVLFIRDALAQKAKFWTCWQRPCDRLVPGSLLHHRPETYAQGNPVNYEHDVPTSSFTKEADLFFQIVLVYNLHRNHLSIVRWELGKPWNPWCLERRRSRLLLQFNIGVACHYCRPWKTPHDVTNDQHSLLNPELGLRFLFLMPLSQDFHRSLIPTVDSLHVPFTCDLEKAFPDGHPMFGPESKFAVQGDQSVTDKIISDNIMAYLDIGHEQCALLLEGCQLQGIPPVISYRNKGNRHVSTHLSGDENGMETCRRLLIDELRANRNGTLDAWQQLYALACVKNNLEDIWHVDCDCSSRDQVETTSSDDESDE